MENEIEWLRASVKDYFGDYPFEIEDDGEMIFLWIDCDDMVINEFTAAMHIMYEDIMGKGWHDLHERLLVSRFKHRRK